MNIGWGTPGNYFAILTLVFIIMFIVGLIMIKKREKNILFGILWIVGGLIGGSTCFIYGLASTNNFVARIAINFSEAKKEISSIEDVKFLKITNEEDDSIFRKIAGNKIYFIFNGKEIIMKYKDIPLKFMTCNTFIKKMAYNTTKENSANIYVNDIPVEKLVKTESNINYECSKEEMVIKSKFN